MFLTPEQKTKLLQLRGLSSSEWSVTDDGNFEQVVIQQPSSGPEVITPKLEPVNSSLSSGVKSFAASALPSIGSGLGAAAGLATLVIEYCKNSNSANSNYKKLEDGV